MKSNLKIFNLKIFIIFNLINLINLQSGKAQMFWNQACSFNGTNTSYVSVPNSTSVNLTGSFTLEAWVNLSSFAAFGRGVIAKGGSLGTSLRYGIRILSSGKVIIATNGAPRCTTATAIQTNTWTHISVTYNSSSGQFNMYINGVSDASVIVAGATPSSNTDSLFIGISGSSTPYNGQLDEVRIWNRELSSAEVAQYYRTSLGTSSGIYNGLVLSMAFQKQSNSTPFSTNDFSGNNNNGNGRNVTAISQTLNPYQTIDQNECIELDGNEDYLVAKDTSTINPTTAVTLECWIYPRDNNSSTLIRRYNDVFSNVTYGLAYSSGSIQGIINNTTFSSTGALLQLNSWNHIAMTYNGVNSAYVFYIDGNFRNSGVNSAGIISTSNNTDSLFIGGVPGSTPDFNGFIDEVRISNRIKPAEEIFNGAFRSIDNSNDPSVSSTDISYNLDGYTYDNAENGGPLLNLRNNTRFSHPAAISNQPRSPLIRDNAINFGENYYSIISKTRIPPSSTSGTSFSLREVCFNSSITDIDVFVALNHTNSSNLNISLLSPANDSLVIFDGMVCNSSDNNIALVFDDQADSSLNNNVYSSFCSKIKPLNNLNSKFGGQNTKGVWALRIRDQAVNDTGMLYTWGIKFNNMAAREKNLHFTAYIQGFYNPATNFHISDTMSVYLRNSTSPYAILDSSRDYTLAGAGLYSFVNITNGVPCYIQLKHRNSIQSWSKFPIVFVHSDAGANFITSPTSVFGNNEIQVDTSPVRFAVYNGDVNQDDIVDGSDTQLIDNDASNFVSGYAPTDVNGDGFIDGSDGVIAGNNSDNFVQAITP